MRRGTRHVQHKKGTLKITLRDEEEEDERVFTCAHCQSIEIETYSFSCCFCEKIYCSRCIELDQSNCPFVLLQDLNREICKDCLNDLLAKELGFKRVIETLETEDGESLKMLYYQENKKKN